MIWLTWRQFRLQAGTALAALAAFAILLGLTGAHVADVYASSGVADCRSASCGQLAGNFLNAVSSDTAVFLLGIAVVVVAPGLIGLFWGAPLIAREFEAGTFRLAWTQSTTRARWLACKLLLSGLAAMAVAEGLSLLYGWWAAPIGHAARLATSGSQWLGVGPFSLLAFDAHGVVPMGYAAFGFALGVTAGVLIRRAVPAMAVTLAIFAAVQVGVPLLVRPHLIPPARTTAAMQSVDLAFGHLTANVVPGQPGAWILSSEAVNQAGHLVTTVPASCISPPSGANGKSGGSGDQGQCMDSLGIRENITYQPPGRYWPIQWAETGIYLALALILAGFCYWRVGRRLP
jgi:ABC-2 family transporter protein